MVPHSSYASLLSHTSLFLTHCTHFKYAEITREAVMDRLRTVVELRFDFIRIAQLDEGKGYMRVEFKDGGSSSAAVTDAEFLLTSQDCTLQVRMNSRGDKGGITGGITATLPSNPQRKRAEEIRRALKFDEIPVLR